MKKILQAANIIALAVTIAINYISNTGIFNGNTIASVSAKYDNLLTPAGYTFSIWSLIYVSLSAFVIYQGMSLFRKGETPEVVLQAGWWFVISCAANCLWVISWLYEYTGLSVVLMLILLFSLSRIIVRTNMEFYDASFKTVAFVWWPVSYYSGWITIALLANVAAYLTKIQWDGFGLSKEIQAIIMIGIAVVINLFLTWKRNMREFAFVGSWGLTGIAVANYGRSQEVFIAALLAAVILFVSSFSHGYKNRNYFPWRKR
ncbi:MAG: tryptophan-rich sensory protein [Ignavibacteria bacterium]